MNTRENLFSFLDHSSSIYYIITDHRGIYLYANSLFRKIFGYMSADISQKSLADSVHPEDQDIYRDAIAECLEKTDRTVSVDLRHPRFDGSLFWTRWEFCAAFDSDGKPEGIQCIGNDISERKRAELEKLQAQENLQLLMNNTEESFMMIGKDLQVLSYNAAADKKINTFAHLSMKKGLSVLALDPPEKHDAIRKIFRDVFKGKEHETEARFPGNNGSAVIYSNHYKPAYSDSKEIVAAVVTSRDITEKKIAEEKLISNERHFRALIENSAEGLAVVTAEGNLIEVSPSGEKLLGFSAKEIRDGEKKYIVHPDDLDAVSKIFSEVVAEPFSLKKSEHRVLTAFGEYIWLAATYHNLLNEPSIQGIVINFRDITEQKKADLALQISEEQYRFLFHLNPQPMWIFDAENLRFLEVNEAAVEHYGYSMEEFHNMTIKDIRLDEDIPVLMNRLKALEGDDRIRYSDFLWRHKKKNGDVIFVEIKSNELHYNGRLARLVLANDITEKVKAEEELIRSNERFAYAVKASSDALWEWDRITDSVYIAEAYTTILGWKVGPDRKFTDWHDYIHPDDKEATLDGFYQALKDPNHEIWQMEYRYRRADGEYATVIDKAYIIRNEAGEPIRVVGSIRDITQRKKAENELIRSNERFVLAGKATSDAIWDADLFSDTIIWGEGFETLFGHKIEGSAGAETWVNNIHPDDKERVLRDHYAVLDDDKSTFWKDEYRFLRADQTVAYVIDKGIIMRNEEGKAYRMIGAMQDITDRKENEEKLARERYLLRTLIDHLPDYIYVKDSQFRHIINNKANVDLLGAQTEEETLGKTVYDYFDPEIAEQYLQHDRYVLDTGKAINNLEEAVITNDYRRRWLLTTKVPLKDEKNHVFGIVGISRDITAQKEIAESLRISNERFSIVSKATNDAIWDWDLTNDEMLWNKAVKHMFGYKGEQVGRTVDWWYNNIHPDDRDRVVSKIRYHIDKRIVKWQDEYRFACADGTYKFVLDRGFILLNNMQSPYRMIGAMMDTTERRKLEAELAEQKINKQREITEATIQAQEKERTELGKELHDNINQILSTTKLYIDMALTETDIREELLQKTHKNISSAIEEIRILSKSLVPPSLGDIGLREAVLELIESLNISQRIKLSLKTSGLDSIELPSNIKLMAYRIIQEQVNNIIKHSKASEAEIKLAVSRKMFNITVKDNGIGFDSRKRGKGIGLNNIISRAELHNGKVEVVSSPGNGCTLKVSLPF